MNRIERALPAVIAIGILVVGVALLLTARADAGVACGVREFSDHECKPKVWKRLLIPQGGFNDSGGGSYDSYSDEADADDRHDARALRHDGYEGSDPDGADYGSNHGALCDHPQTGELHYWTYHGRRYWHEHYPSGRTGRTHLENGLHVLRDVLCQFENAGVNING